MNWLDYDLGWSRRSDLATTLYTNFWPFNMLSVEYTFKFDIANFVTCTKGFIGV